MASVTLPTLVAISIGAIVGANARFLVGGWLAERLASGFPWPTIAINLAGSFLLGFVLVLSAERGLGPWWVRPAIAVGFLGSFTTFPAFSVETVSLIERGDLAGALGNAAGSVLVCVAGAWLGTLLARAL